MKKSSIIILISALIIICAIMVFNKYKNDKINDEENKRYDVILISKGDRAVSTIKLVREITGLGLYETKDFVDNAPQTIKEDVSFEEANELKNRFEEIGSSVEIRER